MQTPSIYSQALSVALDAVYLASLATKNASKIMQYVEHVKEDKTTVTAADYTAQVILIATIRRHFPHDRFMAEETGALLRDSPALLQNVRELITSLHADQTSARQDQIPHSEQEILEFIELGSSPPDETPSGGKRTWILDPIDGTAAFIKGDQYAVCLALIEDGTQKVAALACPNLHISDFSTDVPQEVIHALNQRGLAFSAVAGEGAYVSLLTDTAIRHPLRAGTFDGRAPLQPTMRFVDSVASPYVDRSLLSQFYSFFPQQEQPIDLWSMQVKYIVLALGAADATVRIPHALDYRAFAWDHAGGQLIFAEAGGRITDINGIDFAFGLSRRLERNLGLVATKLGVHSTVLSIVQKVLEKKK